MPKHESEKRTEDTILDLLDIQGWRTPKPPRGDVIRQNEYKSFSGLVDIFKGKSKRKSAKRPGDAYPDFLIASDACLPLCIIEAKANEADIAAAIADAEHYGDCCLEAGHDVIVVGVAGQEKTRIAVRVRRHTTKGWGDIVYAGNPIAWIPNAADITRLLASRSLLDLTPVVPRPEVLAKKADFINRLLREAHIKDEYRPAVIGATILALWESQGKVRRDPAFVLSDINTSCARAFDKAGKSVLANSLYVDEANAHLAGSVWQIIAELEKLNVVNGSFDHDYLGQLYETFFRYTGGNTIGQYFTPRHITRFMADVVQTTADTIVFDPACGTGGFLISALQRCHDTSKLSYQQSVDLVRDKLVGYESEPITAALCVANMIVRGDGKTGIRKDNCFTAKDYPTNQCDIALMNPPFPHKKTDTPPQQFIERALDALRMHGKLGIIIPTSFVVKREFQNWRKQILKNNSLAAVVQLPDELFQPFSSTTTSVIFIERGIPHDPKRKSAFVRIEYDGLTLKKGIRVSRSDGKNQVPAAVDAIHNKKSEPGFSGVAGVQPGDEWSPGAYIPSAVPTSDELKDSIDELLRRLFSFYVRYAKEIANQRSRVSAGDLSPTPYRALAGEARLNNAEKLRSATDTIGAHFDILYGQKELHSREGYAPGDTLVVSPTEEYNGCYGWLDFPSLIQPPFVTVAQTGTIGEAFVQCEPCGVNDDCLILLPKTGTKCSLARLVITAAIIRSERWRFSYGRKLTPARIASFPMPKDSTLEAWVSNKIAAWKKLAEEAVSAYE